MGLGIYIEIFVFAIAILVGLFTLNVFFKFMPSFGQANTLVTFKNTVFTFIDNSIVIIFLAALAADLLYAYIHPSPGAAAGNILLLLAIPFILFEFHQFIIPVFATQNLFSFQTAMPILYQLLSSNVITVVLMIATALAVIINLRHPEDSPDTSTARPYGG